MSSGRRIPFNLILFRRWSSSILNPENLASLTSVQKSLRTLSLLKSENNPQRIVDIARAASFSLDSKIDRIALSVAVSKLAASSSFDAVRRLLEEQKCRPEIKQDERFINKVIILYGKSGMIHEAIQTFEEMNGRYGVRPSVQSLNALLSAALAGKDYKELSRIFNEYPKSFSIQPNLDTYNTLIKSLCESGSSMSVYSVLEEMDRNKVTPNEISYGTLMAGLYAEQRFSEIEKVLDLMKENGYGASLTTTNIRIQSLCKLGRSEEAKALFEGLKSRGILPDVFTFHNLIYGFCKEGDLEEAKSIFCEMGQNKNPTPNSECYFTLIYYLCQGGDFDFALQLCRKCMDNHGWVPNFTTMHNLVKGLVDNNKIEDATEIVEKVKKKFPNKADIWKEVEEKLQ